MRCRAKQEMLSATRTVMKNGRRAMIGLCACCGTRLSVAGKWDDDAVTPAAHNPGQSEGESRLTGSGENG